MTRTRRAAFAASALIAALGFAALGVWQIERRAWKHELVAQVDARIHAMPVAAPGPGKWDAVSAKTDAYRRVTATGVFRHDRETLVQAVTGRGAGYWVLTPLETPGFALLVNRGFVPGERRGARTRSAGNVAGRVTVTGLPPKLPSPPPPHDVSISAASVTAATGRFDLFIKILPRFDPFAISPSLPQRRRRAP